MWGLRISLFIVFFAIVNVRTSNVDPILILDDADKLKSIPSDWNVEDPSIITDIQVININVDKINTGAFENFTNLEDLQFAGRISAVEDDAFTGLMKIRSIKLDGVGIQDIGPKVFHNLNSLTLIEISRNVIKEIHVTNLTMLTHLNLSHNAITELSNDTFVNLENLETIDLSENKIRSVQNGSFDGCPSLTTLKLNKNQIANIEPHALVDLSKLEVLYLSDNNLTTVTVQELPNLMELDLSHNKIIYLEEITLMHLSKLTHIVLHHNLITRVDKDYFISTPKLEYLDLDFNLLKEFNLLDKLEKITNVLVQHNKLQSIELPVITQKNIEVLDLSDNNLTHLNESFQYLINLQFLYLSNNKLKSFPLCLPVSLTHLDLSHNELHEIALDKFCGSVTQGMLQSVDLSSNQFTSYNLTYTNKSLLETQPDLSYFDLSKNFLNADSVKQIQNSNQYIAFLKIEPQRKIDAKVQNEKQNTTGIVVSSTALATVAVFAVIAAILLYKQRRRTNPNPNVNDALMLNELYDDVGPARADDDGRSSPFYHYPIFPIYDSLGRPHIYHYPTFRPWYDEVRPQPIYLSVLPDIPGPQPLEQEGVETEENIYEEID